MRKILVIEDERSIRESILELLKGKGFSVLGAENGSTGIEVAEKYLPDMILCDVIMPHMDGYGVLNALRQNSATATIPFIFLTAQVDKENFRQGMELGADDYLTKPCSASELLAAITSRFEKQAAIQSQAQQRLDDLRNSIALSLPHEFRTPLNGILGLAEVLIDDYQQIDRQEVLDIAKGIYSSAERLYRLIQNFLLYAELEVMMRDGDLIKALRNSETYYPKILITSTATEIAKQVGRETDLHLNLENTKIYISDIKLKKIVEELTSNAFKFSEAGTPVHLTAVATANGMTLYIVDRGRGMTAEQVANLGAYMQFERKFYEQQGSGLGFAIAKRLVELHGGELEIESIPGQQTIVRMTLPGSPTE